MSLDVNLTKELQKKRSENLYRVRVVRSSEQNSSIQLGDHQYLNFCSNDYLGLSNHPEIIAAAKQGLDKYGLGSGGSALITGYTDIHRELEVALAEFTGRSRALLFSSGYAANIGVLSALVKKNDNLFMDKLCHASLIDGAKLSGAKLRRYKHLDTQKLKELLNTSTRGLDNEKWIISESLFSMDGDLAPLKEISKLCQKDTTMYVDDAHGFGVYGENGAGSLSAANLSEEQVPVMIATFGKAFGAVGAFVAGSEALIESLIQNARSYVYTTAFPPAQAAAIVKSLKLVKTENWRREKLFNLIGEFRHKATKRGIPLYENAFGPIQPIFIGDSEKAVNAGKRLADRAIKVSAIRAPTVAKNSARLRITFSAAHEESQVDSLVEALSEVLTNE